jgi:4-hydroxythreonine-4-phosphate dehydrogenase
MTPKLALTCGDPSGIGPEIVASWLATHAADAAGVAVLGPRRWLDSIPLRGAQPIAVGAEDFTPVPGKPSIDGAQAALAAMERAAQGTKQGEFCGVVTGPVSKSWLQKAGYRFPGQTEFFADRWGGEPTMAFCGGKLIVVLLTWHIPLREVPAQLSEANFRRSIAAADELARAFGPADRGDSPVPRIAVCGLNPHAGEDGLLGTEERDAVDPLLDRLRASWPGLSRTQPADTVFGRALRGEFDAIVALYHDQGLAPLKTIDFEESVNVTLGLPFVRTSPDHGTAYDIAGRGVASARSFANAVDVARRLIKRRAAR